MVSILFVQQDSIYKKIRGGELGCWDANRDARTWPGGCSIVAHPPCRAWSCLRAMAKPDPGEKELAPYAVSLIRRWGGVLEHPRGSTLWPYCSLPIPGTGMDEYGGYSLSVDQHWWGHQAKKATLLYIVGCLPRKLPLIPMNFNAVTHVVATSDRHTAKKELSVKARSATPEAFAEWLVTVADRCNSVNKKM